MIITNINAGFYQIRERYLDTAKLFLLRLFKFDFFKMLLSADLIKNIMVNILILKKKRTCIVLNRILFIEKDKITITDKINAEKHGYRRYLFNVSFSEKNIPFHMASAGYYHKEKLNLKYTNLKNVLFDKRIHISTTIMFNYGKIDIIREILK